MLLRLSKTPNIKCKHPACAYYVRQAAVSVSSSL